MSPRKSIIAIRRQQLIEAARRVVLRKGYHRATIHDIAAEAGVSTGIPHHYFPDRDELLFATLEHVAEQMRQMVATAVERAGTPRDKLEAYVRAASPAHQIIRDGWLVWLEYWADAIRDPRLAEFHRGRYTWWREQLGGILRQGMAEGCFRSVDVEDFVLHLIGLVDGLSIQASVHDSKVAPADFERIVLEHVRSRLYLHAAELVSVPTPGT
jgi:AcrR family transcriptional regulator